MPNSDSASDCAAPLVEVWRGQIVESRHRGHLIAVDARGRVAASLGAGDAVTYLRSSAKPFQALPLLTTGAAERFGFTDKEVAIACGSHNGEPMHVEVVESMLRKIGSNANALQCGVHEPYSVEVARELIRTQTPPSVLQNNCSGKHAGMLAVAKHLNAAPGTYLDPSHPVQQKIIQTVSEFADVEVDRIAIGIDGCAAPVFGVTVKAMALMYARLVSPGPEIPASTRAACTRIVTAMREFPEMIGGTKDRLDTELIRLGKGRLISKIGAEGVYTVGVLPSHAWPNGLGLALKVEDGDDRRARPPAVIEALRQLGVIDTQDLDELKAYAPARIVNRRGDYVGEARAAFTLDVTRI